MRERGTGSRPRDDDAPPLDCLIRQLDLARRRRDADGHVGPSDTSASAPRNRGGSYYGYLGLYILGYVADDTVMVATAVMALGSRKLTERGGRWLKLLSGVVMLALGVMLVAWPDWLL